MGVKPPSLDLHIEAHAESQSKLEIREHVSFRLSDQTAQQPIGDPDETCHSLSGRIAIEEEPYHRQPGQVPEGSSEDPSRVVAQFPERGQCTAKVPLSQAVVERKDGRFRAGEDEANDAVFVERRRAGKRAQLVRFLSDPK